MSHVRKLCSGLCALACLGAPLGGQGILPPPPGVAVVGNGGCVWEDCEGTELGPWRADSGYALFDAPDTVRSMRARISAGQLVTVLEYATHLDQVGVFVATDTLTVSEDQSTGSQALHLRRGDTAFVTGKDGTKDEIWFHGKEVEADAPIDVYQGFHGPRDRATLVQRLRWSLWKKIRTEEGRVAWIRVLIYEG